ncbi:winged helix-turn-helix domain-containing protein [uncultured Maricaulis sp.]|uniref:winged helix-turn-helix domain-containing protein n=1 Tax=uncultured Maricaulis sp. TaxID=174710 RepID=UPI0026159E3F|nr:winged helix-turn-helix domain-containing protein [uncultured Maricaulis sp.]
MLGKRVTIGEWLVDATANRISGEAGEIELEPRVMDLLMLFAGQPGEVISKDEIAAALWGEVHVNDDALTRTVFKLRKALGDDARNARYIATVPKRGYRLVAEVSTPVDRLAASAESWRRGFGVMAVTLAVLFVAMLGWGLMFGEGSAPANHAASDRLARADGFYHQYTRADNEAALRLYESVLDDDADNAAALAGLANALTQRLIRFQGSESEGNVRSSLSQALEEGWLESEAARAGLERAVAMARRATELDPSHARAWRALGLAVSAAGEFSWAERSYERALVIDPDDWGTMINLSGLHRLMGQPERSTPYLEQAWISMERRYARDPVEIRPWHSSVGLSVAEAKLADGAPEEAELWYRRVLTLDPFNARAVRGLAALLEQSGNAADAAALCDGLARSTDATC